MVNKFLQFALSLRAKYPKFDIIIKDDNKLMKLLYRYSLMKFWNPHFMTDVVTSVGYKVYMPLHLIGTEPGYAVLRHEAVHIAQWQRWGLWLWLSYLFCLPVLLTARAYWEFKAYTETMKVEFEETGHIRFDTVKWIANLFCGPGYIFMYPFRDSIINKLNKQRLLIMSGQKQ